MATVKQLLIWVLVGSAIGGLAGAALYGFGRLVVKYAG